MDVLNFFFFKFISFQREREQTGEERERERERISQAGSAEPDVGLELLHGEIMT